MPYPSEKKVRAPESAVPLGDKIFIRWKKCRTLRQWKFYLVEKVPYPSEEKKSGHLKVPYPLAKFFSFGRKSAVPFRTFWRNSFEVPYPCQYSVSAPAWRKSSTKDDLTKSGYLRNPDRQELIDIVSVCWYKITEDCVRKSFIGAEIVPTGQERSDCD